jgi:hypothetical protein
MPARNSLAIFLVFGNRLARSKIPLIVRDLIEDYNERREEISQADLEELGRIERVEVDISKSRLFDLLKPYCVPFFEQRNENREVFKCEGSIWVWEK